MLTALPVQTCIELRDKYIRLSCQRLEDNPINYDGDFAPPKDSTSTSASHPNFREEVSSATTDPLLQEPRKGNLPSNLHSSRDGDSLLNLPRWHIYPKPPKPHWESRDPFAVQITSESSPEQQEFNFSDCEIPGEHPFVYEMDKQGVYQIYEDEAIGGLPIEMC